MKEILISIQPYWVEYILNGKKTIEVRKTAPKINEPFKVYVYCTKGKILRDNLHCQCEPIENETKQGNMIRFCLEDRNLNNIVGSSWRIMNGKVVGEFVCDRIESCLDATLFGTLYGREAYMGRDEIFNYGKLNNLFAWHITELKVYCEPKQLSEFGLARPPQSWQYVQSLEVLKDD